MGDRFEADGLIPDRVFFAPSLAVQYSGGWVFCVRTPCPRVNTRSALGAKAVPAVGMKRTDRQHLAASMHPAAELSGFDYHARLADLPLQVVPLVYR